MLRRRRKIQLHGQARTFIMRLQKYFYLESVNNGPLLPLDQVCERVAAALHLTTDSVVQVTQEKKKFCRKIKAPKNDDGSKKYSKKKRDVRSFIVKKRKTPNYKVKNKSKILSTINLNTKKLKTSENQYQLVKIEKDMLKPENDAQIFVEDIIIDDITQTEIDSMSEYDCKPFLNSYKSENLETFNESPKSLDQEVFNWENNFKKLETNKNSFRNPKLKSKSKLGDSGTFILSEDKSMATCKICMTSVASRTKNQHLRNCHPSVIERNMKLCELCNQSFVEEKLKLHTLLMHGKNRSKCAYCKIDFPSTEILKIHVPGCQGKKRKRVVTIKEQALVKCDVCGKVMQSASLRAHLNRIHFGLVPVCQHCGKSFGNNYRLKEHYRAKHGYEKLKCSRCDFTSSSQVSLDNHERRHDGIKPFVCDKCGARFHAAYLLNQHKKSHATVRAYKCAICPSAFKSQNSLTGHKNTCHKPKFKETTNI